MKTDQKPPGGSINSEGQRDLPFAAPRLYPRSHAPTKWDTRVPRAGTRGIRRSRRPEAECLGEARVKTERFSFSFDFDHAVSTTYDDTPASRSILHKPI